jgi:hypothetical protein
MGARQSYQPEEPQPLLDQAAICLKNPQIGQFDEEDEQTTTLTGDQNAEILVNIWDFCYHLWTGRSGRVQGSGC